jgi:hypothetical protein
MRPCCCVDDRDRSDRSPQPFTDPLADPVGLDRPALERPPQTHWRSLIRNYKKQSEKFSGNREHRFGVELAEVKSTTHAARYTEQELRIERYRALEREVTDPLALGLLRDIVLELEEELREGYARKHPSAGRRARSLTNQRPTWSPDQPYFPNAAVI